MKKFTKRQVNIIKTLYEKKDFYSANNLALDLGVSVRTIKTDVNLIHENNIDDICKIISKSGSGYKLVTGENFDDLLNDEMIHQVEINSLNIPETYFERMIYVIRKLLVVDYHVKSDDLIDELYLSKSTLYIVLKEVRQQLAKFRLTLISRPNYGLIIVGTEVNKRLAISEFFFHNISSYGENMKIDLLDNEETSKEYNDLIKLISEYTNRYNIIMSKGAIDSVALHLMISIKRSKFYNYAIPDDEMIIKFQNLVEFKVAQGILSAIEDKYKLLFPIGETVYLAMQIKVKKVNKVSKLSVMENKKLNACISTIIFEINDNFGLQIKSDGDFFNYLYYHIINMLGRLNLHMPLRNPLVYENLREYLFATKITHSAYSIIQQFYNVEFNIDEFGYILLYVNLEILKSDLNKKTEVAFLTDGTNAEALMYYLEICEAFSSQRYQINKVASIEKNYDLVVSTHGVDTELPSVVCRGKDYLNVIKEKLVELRYHSFNIYKYFKKEHCCFNLPGETKGEVLNNLYNYLYDNDFLYQIKDDYNEFHDDELGNGVVHLQDTFRNIKDGMCFIATLEKQIYWSNNFVKLIVITKTKRDGDSDLYSICRLVSNIVSDKNNVNRICDNANFDVVFEMIESRGYDDKTIENR